MAVERQGECLNPNISLVGWDNRRADLEIYSDELRESNWLWFR